MYNTGKEGKSENLFTTGPDRKCSQELWEPKQHWGLLCLSHKLKCLHLHPAKHYLHGAFGFRAQSQLCRFMQTDGVASCDTVSCFRCHWLDFTRFLTQILGDCVSKSGSQWEMLFLAKEAILEGAFVVDLGTQPGWHNRQAALHKDVGKAFTLQESCFSIKPNQSYTCKGILALFLSPYAHHTFFFFFNNLFISVTGQSSFPLGFSSLCI